MKESSRWIGTAETAKLMRAALKAAFPATKFSVRSHRGSSINVYWTDGPTTARVKAITGQFEGGGFDGMIDMAFSYDHWLLPDGSTQVAYSPGTSGSMGIYAPISTNRPHDDAELVHFGSTFVFENRKLSAEFARKLVAQVARYWGVDAPEVVEGFWTYKGVTTSTGWKFADESLNYKPVREDLGQNGSRDYYSWSSSVRQASEDATKFAREEDPHFQEVSS